MIHRSMLFSLILTFSVATVCFAQDNIKKPTDLDQQQAGDVPKKIHSGTDLVLSTKADRERDRKKAMQQWDSLERELRSKIPSAARSQFGKFALPAIIKNDNNSFLASMESLIIKHPEDTIDLIDAYCRQLGYGSLRDRFSKALINAVQTNPNIQTKNIHPKFAGYISNVLADAVKSDLEELSQHPIMQEPLIPAEDWRQSEGLFWQVHVWRNRFSNMQQLLNYSIAIQEPRINKARRSKKNDAQVEAEIEKLSLPIRLAETVGEKYSELLEREAELRMKELPRAEEALRLHEDFEDEINAAFTLEMHAGALEDYFRDREIGEFKRIYLNDPINHSTALDLVESARKHGDEAIEKALLLRIGAHWWLRGRYGMGTMAQGLLKPPEAMKDQRAMFGLFMPKDRPRAIGDYEESYGDVVAGYQRRHYFSWAVEKRDVYTKLTAGNKTSGPTKLAATNRSYFW